jgi:hypothetical protein
VRIATGAAVIVFEVRESSWRKRCPGVENQRLYNTRESFGGRAPFEEMEDSRAEIRLMEKLFVKIELLGERCCAGRGGGGEEG